MVQSSVFRADDKPNLVNFYYVSADHPPQLLSSPHSMDVELNLNSLHAVVKYGSVDVVQKFLQVNDEPTFGLEFCFCLIFSFI